METGKSINDYGETIISFDLAIDILMDGGDPFDLILSDQKEIDQFNLNCKDVLSSNLKMKPETSGISVEDFHKERSSNWRIPDKYKEMDIYNYVLSLAKTQIEIDRVNAEWIEYKKFGVEVALPFFVYFVDTMRKEGVVWGVGRGSSVASYILYLIGVHRIDSIKYELDINEFLK